MNNQQRIDYITKMIQLLDAEESILGESGTLEVSNYTNKDRLQLEIDHVFNQHPIIVAHASQLAEPNAFVTITIGNKPIIVNRDREGRLHAFINSCRHRGAKLTDKACGKAKAFKCPYHAWGYMDDGTLQFIPNKEAFPGLDKSQHALKELAIKESAGFIWLLPTNTDTNLSGYLGDIEHELLAFDLDKHVVRVSDIQTPACNWKLVIDAFSEGYHLKSLHKNSVEPFFQEHGVVFEKRQLHSLSIGARNEIIKAKNLDEDQWDFRAWTTPFYTLFPNTVLVFHPDWVSRITVFPMGTDQCRVYHDMLVPDSAALEDPYWDRTFLLINKQVFAAEDIAVCESIQSAAKSGADRLWPVGGLETPVLWFHQALENAINK